MPTFSIECADRDSGKTYTITTEAQDQTAAQSWAVRHGHLVGRITRAEVAAAGPAVVALDRRTINALQWRMLGAMVAALLIFIGVLIVLGVAGLSAMPRR